MIAVSDARWQEAQAGELAFWRSANRTLLCRQLDALYIARLGITRDDVRGLSVLDIGGGPLPLGALMDLPLHEYTIVDPLQLPPEGALTYPGMVRVSCAAEDYDGPQVDEVWGYNVLQHVRDPQKVLDTAKRHAPVVRWFDWVDTPIASHHPHSLSAAWIAEQFADWHIVSEQRGSVPVPHEQHYIAIVAARP